MLNPPDGQRLHDTLPKKPAADRGSPQATGPSTNGWSAAVNRDLLQLFTTPQGKKKRSPCRHSLGQDSRGSVHTGNNLVKCRSERGKKRAKFFKGFNISLDSGSMKCASWPELQEIQPYK